MHIAVILAYLSAVLASDVPTAAAKQESNIEMTRLREAIIAKWEEVHPGELPPLLTNGRSGEFSDYIEACVGKIVLTDPMLSPAASSIPDKSTIMFTFSIRPNGTVKEIVVHSNSGGGELQRLLVVAIRRAAPFPPYPEELKKKHSEVVITRTAVFHQPQKARQSK